MPWNKRSRCNFHSAFTKLFHQIRQFCAVFLFPSLLTSHHSVWYDTPVLVRTGLNYAQLTVQFSGAIKSNEEVQGCQLLCLLCEGEGCIHVWDLPCNPGGATLSLPWLWGCFIASSHVDQCLSFLTCYAYGHTTSLVMAAHPPTWASRTVLPRAPTWQCQSSGSSHLPPPGMGMLTSCSAPIIPVPHLCSYHTH